MIFERTITYTLYSPYPIYFRMVIDGAFGKKKGAALAQLTFALVTCRPGLERRLRMLCWFFRFRVLRFSRFLWTYMWHTRSLCRVCMYVYIYIYEYDCDYEYFYKLNLDMYMSMYVYRGVYTQQYMYRVHEYKCHHSGRLHVASVQQPYGLPGMPTLFQTE